MGLLITLYLIMINANSSLEAPPGRRISYTEVWFFGCQAPVVVAILEYGFILAMKKIDSKDYNLTKAQEKRLDFFSFIFSAVMFLLFNTMFWGYYILNK